ncbi:MAG: PucR family transcriptional regulator [Oscillospiraceae bacterium]
MTIPLPVILDALSDYSFIYHVQNPDSLRFSWASFLPGEEQPLKRDRLYLCTLEQAEESAERISQNYVLCVSEHEKKPSTLPPNCIFVEKLHSVFTLAEMIQERICLVRDWVFQLNETVMVDPSYQSLLDLSEPMLGNPVYILDASYKLLAFTQNTLDDDEIDVHLRKAGYHSEEALIALRNCQHFKASSGETGTQVNPPGNPNKYATVSKRIWDRGMPVLHVIMVCSNTETPDANLLALFEIMVQNCALRFQHQQTFTPRTGHLYDSLFNDILFGKLDDPHIITERAKISGLPLEGTFRCYKIMLRDARFYSIAHVLDEFLALFPSARAISHGYEIIVLDQQITPAEDRCDASLLPFLEKYNAVCGISEPFHFLLDFFFAYTQAGRAIEIGQPLSEYEPVWKAAAEGQDTAGLAQRLLVFYYDDVFVYYALSQRPLDSFDPFRNTPYLDLVRDLIQNDLEKGTNNAQVLYTYLTSERRATKTGQLLHMHRNNVLYRIPRIEEQIGLDLDDYWVRTKLLLAFHLIELEEARKHTRTAST